MRTSLVRTDASTLLVSLEQDTIHALHERDGGECEAHCLEHHDFERNYRRAHDTVLPREPIGLANVVSVHAEAHEGLDCQRDPDHEERVEW